MHMDPLQRFELDVQPYELNWINSYGDTGVWTHNRPEIKSDCVWTLSINPLSHRGSVSSSESSDKENKAPVAAVVPIKKKPGIKVSQEAPATPTKVAKAVAVTPKTPRKKKRPTPPAVQPKKKKKESLPKNKPQLLQLAQKFSQAIEKNF